MRASRLFLPLLSLLSLVPLLCAASPGLAFTEGLVTVSGMTPGGEVLLFGVARHGLVYANRYFVYREALLDGDGDGEVSFEPPEGLPWKSSWVAVDSATGEVVVGAPEPYRITVSTLPPGALAGSAPDLLEELAVDEEWLEVLVVRPGVGGWGGRAFEGGVGDQDGAANGRAVVHLPDLPGVTPNGAPFTRLHPKDVLAVMLPEKGEILLFTLTPKPQSGAAP